MVKQSAQFWRDRPVFVTGAMGLVGSATVKKLLDLGASVVILQRDWIPDAELVQSGLMEKVSIVRGELSDLSVLERVLGEFEIATVLHLAAQAVVGVANKNPLSTFESNIRGTWNLLEACRRSPLVKQVVVASSDKAYGEQPKLPYTEDMPLLAKHPYDVSKACTDMLAQSYAHSFDLPVTISRCGNFYGPGDLNWNRIVPGTIRSILNNESPVVRSDGTFVRDYLYVDDGADAYLTLAEKMAANPTLKGEVFNFSTEEPMTVLALVQAITKLMQSDLKPDVRNEASNEILKQHLSAEKAKQMLGWSAAYGLDEGLQKTIEWYRDFLT
ncbi:MAG: NAD-dependent epimerase/dehydratase family protein [Candidatus Peribacteraceae bacterium]